MLRQGQGGRRGAALVLAGLVALAAAGCSGTPDETLEVTDDLAEPATEEEREAPTDDVTDPAAPTEEAMEPAEPTDEPTEVAAPTDEEPSQAELEDGRHPAFLTELDGTARTVTFDLIQFLTGQEAADAYAEDVPEDPDPGPPNDYWIRNESSELRTLPIASDVTVSVIRLGEPSGAEGVPWTLEELPAHLADQAGAPEGQLGWSPFWLTVEDGVVVAIEEQYLP
jgi:hypothetical protein